MKFKLIENKNSGLKNESTIDTLNEMLLYENDNIIKSLIHQYSNQEYTPQSFWTKYNNKYKNEWIKFIDDNYGKDVSNWSVHHINGIHPNNRNDKNNDYSNLAFVRFHKDITIAYIACIEDYLLEKSRDLKSNPEVIEIYKKLFCDIDALEKILLMYGKIKNIEGLQPSQIFRINMSLVKQLYNEIPNILEMCFNNMIKANSQDILPLSDIENVSNLMHNLPPIKEN